jgi:hypothetical protein
MNSMVTTMMSPWAMSSRQRSRADGSEPQLAVACVATCTPGASRRIFVAARCTLSGDVIVQRDQDKAQFAISD